MYFKVLNVSHICVIITYSFNYPQAVLGSYSILARLGRLKQGEFVATN